MLLKRKSRYRWLRRLARILIILIGIFICACLIFDHYVQFRKDDEELMAGFRQQGIDGKVGYYESRGRRLRYASVGNDSLPTLLMIHGSPGSMSYYAGRYADPEIHDHFKVYTIDRPGYGYSGLGDPEPSIHEQAEMIRVILDSLHHATHPIIISAGSYGASIACRIAMDHPELVDGLALTGPSLGPGLETTFWFTNLIEHDAFRWFIPRAFRSANTEKVNHRTELEKMRGLWKNIRIPVTYLQGADDNIVDTANAGFARTHLVNAPFLQVNFVKGRKHRLAQFEWPTIRRDILTVYQQALLQKAGQKASIAR